MDIRCARCGARFSCGSGLSCWCMAPPHIPMPQGDETCLCPACLDAARAAAKGELHFPRRAS